MSVLVRIRKAAAVADLCPLQARTGLPREPTQGGQNEKCWLFDDGRDRSLSARRQRIATGCSAREATTNRKAATCHEATTEHEAATSHETATRRSARSSSERHRRRRCLEDPGARPRQ